MTHGIGKGAKVCKNGIDVKTTSNLVGAEGFEARGIGVFPEPAWREKGQSSNVDTVFQGETEESDWGSDIISTHEEGYSSPSVAVLI